MAFDEGHKSRAIEIRFDKHISNLQLRHKHDLSWSTRQQLPHDLLHPAIFDACGLMLKTIFMVRIWNLNLLDSLAWPQCFFLVLASDGLSIQGFS